MSDILEQAQKVEAFRRLLNAANSSPGEIEFDLLLQAFMVERERLVSQPISKALDGLIMANAATASPPSISNWRTTPMRKPSRLSPEAR